MNLNFYLFVRYIVMETDDNEVDLTTQSNNLNDTVGTVEEWVPDYDDELKPIVGKIFDTLEEGGDFYKRYAHTVGLVYVIQLKQKIKMVVLNGSTFFAQKKVSKPKKK